MFEFRNISIGFGGMNVLKDLSIQLTPGDRVGLIGGNGSGKSTLINIATGFLIPQRGQILLDGKLLTGMPAWQYARKGIRRSFQSVRLLPNVPLQDQFKAEVQDIKTLRSLLQETTLVKYLNQFPSEIPLPIQRKAEVVRALIANPRYLFLDEPCAGLTNSELSDFAVFLSNHVPVDCGLIVVEHRRDLIEMVAKRLIILDSAAESSQASHA